MAKDAIWRLHFRTVRCHTEKTTIKTQLLAFAGAGLANTYYWHEKAFAWDVDVPSDSVKKAERAMGVKCDHTTSCLEVR